MSCFRMPETAAIGITDVLLFVVITMLRNIPEIGKIVLNVKKILKRRCMFSMAQMNTILRNWKILRTINLPNVLSVVL